MKTSAPESNTAMAREGHLYPELRVQLPAPRKQQPVELTAPHTTSSTALHTAPAAAKAASAVPRLTAVSPSRCPMAAGLSGSASHTCPASPCVSASSHEYPKL